VRASAKVIRALWLREIQLHLIAASKKITLLFMQVSRLSIGEKLAATKRSFLLKVAIYHSTFQFNLPFFLD